MISDQQPSPRVPLQRHIDVLGMGMKENGVLTEVLITELRTNNNVFIQRIILLLWHIKPAAMHSK